MRFHLAGAIAHGAALLLVPVALLAGTPTPSEPTGKTTPKVQPAPAAQGQMRAYIDPETGRLVGHPVTEEQKRAARQAQKEPDQSVVQTIVYADGSTEYILNGAADAELIATVSSDGKVHTHCTDPTHNHALDQHPATTEAADER